MGRWIKKHKGLFIFLCILLTVIILIGALISYSMYVSKIFMESLTSAETAQVQRMNLVSSVPSSGTIISGESKSVVGKVTGVDVSMISVSVGDYVEEGDLICVLDAEKLEQTLAIAQANLAATEQSLNLQVAAAQRAYADALEAQNQAASNAEVALGDAQRAQTQAYAQYNATASAASATIAKADSIIANIDILINYYSKVAELNSAISAKEAEISALKESNAGLAEGDEGYAEYQSSLATLESENSALKSEKATLDTSATAAAATAISSSYSYIDTSSVDSLNQLKTEQQNIKNEANLQIQSAYNSYLLQKENYEQAASNAEDPTSSTASSVASARDSLTNAQTSASTGTLSSEQQIAEYEEQIANCMIYAPISGIVTSVNFSNGDTYTGASIVTIEDTSKLHIETYIDEYSISKISLGQEVQFKTNATGDLMLEGEVISIAPRATAGSSTVSYKVEVLVVTDCEDLRLDMSAKLSIILEKVENVIVVPYDAIQTDDNGETFVEILHDSMVGTGETESEIVYVTTGMESDYYIEITSGNLTEEMTVLVPRDEFTAMDLYSLLEEEGALGGF